MGVLARHQGDLRIQAVVRRSGACCDSSRGLDAMWFTADEPDHLRPGYLQPQARQRKLRRGYVHC